MIFDHVVDDRVDAQRFEVQHLALAEREQLARERRGALGRLENLGDVLAARIGRLDARAPADR